MHVMVATRFNWVYILRFLLLVSGDCFGRFYSFFLFWAYFIHRIIDDSDDDCDDGIDDGDDDVNDDDDDKAGSDDANAIAALGDSKMSEKFLMACCEISILK